MALAAADILAGPVLRRVESDLVSVWIAYTALASLPVTLKVFKGLGSGDQAALVVGTNIPADQNPAVRAGAKLFVALAMWEPAPSTPLEPGGIYSYDIEIGGTGLAALGLLKDGTITARGTSHEHFALGYAEDQLPSFVAPPASVADLRILQGSCRSHSGNGHDAMPPIDDLIKEGRSDASNRPHMLWLTGDQIYADEAAPELMDMIAGLTAEIFGHEPGKTAETLTVEWTAGSAGTEYPVDLEHFPPSRRGNLLNDVAKFTSTSTEAHAMGFGEYVGMYLTAWSNTGWRWNAETLLIGQLEQYRKYLGETLKLRNALEGDPADANAAVYEVTGDDRKVVNTNLRDMYPFYEAWRLLPEAWRQIDENLTDEAVEKAWGKDGEGVAGKEFDHWKAFKNVVVGGTGTAAPRGEIAVAASPDADKAKLAAALTPSWYAGRKHFANRNLPSGKDELLAIPDKFETPTFHRRIEKLEWGYRQLARVRRLLANVPVYMTFDDHEITDDWNITPKWARETRSRSLARGIIRNGLSAFTLCQSWGNDPRRYLKGTIARTVLDDIDALYGGATVDARASASSPVAQRLEQRFDLVKTRPPDGERMTWHFTYDHADYQFIALDTRTWRGFEANANADIGVGFSMDDTATLLTDEALKLQIPEQPPSGINFDGITFLIAPAPLIGYPVVESVVQPIINLADMVHLGQGGPFERSDKSFRVGRVNRDPENWGFSPALLAAMFARLSTRRRVLVLSGDVHYTFTCRLKYWRYAPDPDPRSWPVETTTHFIQLTSSAFRAQRDDLAPIVAIDVLQQLGEVSSHVRRMGWPRSADILAPPPVQAGATPFNFHLSHTLSDVPPTAATDAIPGDALFVRRPEWALDTEMLLDNRPDRYKDLRPVPPDLTLTGEQIQQLSSFGAFHVWQAEHTLPRHWLWWANFTQIDFTGSPPNVAHHRKFTFDPSGGFTTAKPFLIVDIPLDDGSEAATGARPMLAPKRTDFQP